MPADSVTTAPTALTIAMYAICLAGLFLLWRWTLSPEARNTPHYARVRHIAAPGLYFAAMCVFTIFTGYFAQFLFIQICKWTCPTWDLRSTFVQMCSQGAFDLGAIAAILYARRFLQAIENIPRIAVAARLEAKPAPAITIPQAILVGIGLFCIIRTVIIPVALIWNWLLDLANVTANEQQLVEIFRSETSPVRLAIYSIIAIIIAPIAEEMLFRGGLFGYLRTRIHRQFAIMIPSLIFALIHLNLRNFPLFFVLSVVLCIAYERTGRLTVPIIGHALLNFSTIGAILLGVQI